MHGWMKIDSTGNNLDFLPGNGLAALGGRALGYVWILIARVGSERLIPVIRNYGA